MSGPPPEGTGNPNLDSITLGQLRTMVGSVPKPKQWWYDFSYDDEDTVMNEIDEFYSYVEMPQVTENLNAWKDSFPEDWTKSSIAKRRAHVEFLLEGLEHKDAVIRFTNARRLFYILQGTFAETVSPEHQLHWIFENSKVLRAANGVSTIVSALMIAGSKHDVICGFPDTAILPNERNDIIEELITEISVYLGMLYHLVEVFKGHEDFADELMSLEPPLPVYLFNIVAGLKERSSKAYPIKKLLLLLWKSILACCGGMRDHARVKRLARELASLSPDGVEGRDGENDPFIKSSPFDIDAFRQEMTVKYPTFVPPPLPSPEEVKAPIPAPVGKLAQAYSPIPIRHHYDHNNQDNMSGLHGQMPFLPQHQQQQQGQFRQQLPSTPAPSPPPQQQQQQPGGKPKKQQYQTDQGRPFLFPFSRAENGKIPYAIDEADKLYNRHMHVSLALLQMWRTREDCMTVESGLEKMPGQEDNWTPSTYLRDPESADTLPDITLLDSKLEEVTKIINDPESSTSEKRKAKEVKEDLMRLKRIEDIYKAVLPVLSGFVLVLLKLLLATVSAGTNNMQNPPPSSNGNVFGGVPSPQEQPSQPPMTLDETDVVRHREINAKACSAILLLTLKWFKVSHVMKFHQLGQLLLDSNCLLLIMKMFGLQEVSNQVISKADSPDNNFFRYCLLNFSRNAYPNQQLPSPPTRRFETRTRILPNGEPHVEEVEMITEYSWRNFFSTINFAKVMQKLSKGRSHRIYMLVQYKSSAVLKRMLRVQHPMLQISVLKLIKSQVPFGGRKWRQTNMKVITAIYLNCRPDLRDEWLTGSEVEDATDATAQEAALRHLVKFYNTQRYGPQASQHAHAQRHGRSGSTSQPMLEMGSEFANANPNPIVRTPNIVEADVFPPARSQAPDPSIFLPYMSEDIVFEEEYEEYLSDMGWSDLGVGSGAASPSNAWERLPQEDFAADISDSESVVSIGDLGEEMRKDDKEDENLNNWEHMSPKTMAALPKSPAGHRRSSSGGGLRPVVPFGLDDPQSSGVALEDEEDDLPGPAPRENNEPYAAGAGVDEVEYVYGV